MTHPVYRLSRGESPLIVSMPHCGTMLPQGFAARLTPEAQTLCDTDWHIPRLYDFLRPFDATILEAKASRLVVDLNRPPSNESLYPGQATTGLCPTTLFDGRPVYRPNLAPNPAEVEARIENWWRPYHIALAAEIARIKAKHGFALLYDAHSIKGRIPRLFEGTLPDLNLGTVHGNSVGPDLERQLEAILDQTKADGFSSVTNGRFVGGYITRHYGTPTSSVFAIQMELVQSTYLDEDSATYEYIPERAARLQAVLKRIVAAFASWRPNR